MLIAVISDTHMTRPGPLLETAWDQYLSAADVLLHCGDVTGFETWQYLCRHPAFHAVQGNCDYDAQLSAELEPMLRLDLDGLHVGLTHGWGPRSQVPVKVAQAFGTGFHLVCYGHTHNPHFGRVEGVTLLNPGSLGEHGSLALVEVSASRNLEVRFVAV